MDANGEYNVSPRKMYYSAIVTGKRIPAIWVQAPRLDSKGEGVVKSTTSGMIYSREGPEGEKNFAPLLQNTISVMKMAIIIMAITTGAIGAWYGTFGCLGEYIQTSWLWVSQFVIFLVILINIWIVNAESPNATREVTWTGWSILGALLTWILLNMIAKIGDTWLFFDTPFWPGPMTYWGATMLLGALIYALDLQRDFWAKTRSQSKRDYANAQVEFYTILESSLTILFLLITFWRFGDELLISRKKKGKNFNFLDFFLGFNHQDKNIVKDKVTINRGRCKDFIIKKLDKEIKEGIKNSWWHKFRDNIW